MRLSRNPRSNAFAQFDAMRAGKFAIENSVGIAIQNGFAKRNLERTRQLLVALKIFSDVRPLML